MRESWVWTCPDCVGVNEYMDDAEEIDPNLIDRVVQLCSRIGMITEDVSALPIDASRERLEDRVADCSLNSHNDETGQCRGVAAAGMTALRQLSSFLPAEISPKTGPSFTAEGETGQKVISERNSAGPSVRWSVFTASAYLMFVAMYRLIRCTSGAGRGT